MLPHSSVNPCSSVNSLDKIHKIVESFGMIYDPEGSFPQILVQIGDELPEGGEYWGKVVQGENMGSFVSKF